MNSGHIHLPKGGTQIGRMLAPLLAIGYRRILILSYFFSSNISLKCRAMPTLSLHKETVIQLRSWASSSEGLGCNFLMLDFLLHTSSRITATSLFSV